MKRTFCRNLQASPREGPIPRARAPRWDACATPRRDACATPTLGRACFSLRGMRSGSTQRSVPSPWSWQRYKDGSCGLPQPVTSVTGFAMTVFVGLELCLRPEASQSLRPQSRRNQIIFHGDMSLAKNTFRGADCGPEGPAGSAAQSPQIDACIDLTHFIPILAICTSNFFFRTSTVSGVRRSGWKVRMEL